MLRQGHYISLHRDSGQDGFYKPLSMPGVAGIQKRYLWRELETTLNRYDFDQLRSDLELAALLGGVLVPFIEDKTFTPEQPLPEYLWRYAAENRRGGFTAARWLPEVRERMVALCEAIRDRFDAHPGFGGIAIQESAPGLTDEALDALGYDSDDYAEALRTISRHCDYLYLNYIPRGQHLLAEVINPARCAVGGPDVLPDSEALKLHVYPHFELAPNRVRQFSSMQHDSYEHPRGDSGELWRLDDMVDWAARMLRVETLFWNEKTWGAVTVEDAYAAIALRPVL